MLDSWQYSSIPCVKQRCTSNVGRKPDVLRTHCERRTDLELIECNTQSVNNFVTDRWADILGVGGGRCIGCSVSCAP